MTESAVTVALIVAAALALTYALDWVRNRWGGRRD